ncbi:hypothetical protein FB468_1472 [Leucobacter komagatae]|uniref:DUF7847 domain-containing protein n=1 Tax=Leucobacter komagatae TaxID=55969 RepID=A0A542Y5U9_9MICO|nr:hypothetical protein [Leucobacter komagatae]TQL43451.1 hypothetical protein FB468_1472 [Leucobacter komagatae]
MTPQPSAQHPRPSGTPVPPLFPGPLTFGAIFSRGFSAVARNPKPLVLWAMLLPLAVHLLFAIPTALSDAAGLNDEPSPRYDSATVGILLLTLLSSVVYYVVSVLGGAVLQGYVANSVRFEALGHRGTPAELWAATRPVFGRLVGYGGLVIAFAIALGIAAGIAGVIAGIIFGLVAGLSQAMAPAVVLLVLLLLGIFVPILWFSARISIAPAIIVCERTSAWNAVRRAWSLTRGRGWRVVGLYLLLGLVAAAAAGILVLLFWGLTQALMPSPAGETGITGPRFLASYLAGLPVVISGAAILPVTAAATANVYLDARTRQDPLAASLYQYHAARAAGYAPAQLADPFVTVPPGSHLG